MQSQKVKIFRQKSQISQIPLKNVSFRKSQNSSPESQKVKILHKEVRKVKPPPLKKVKQVKNFSVKSQKVYLVSSKSHKSESQNPLLDPPLIGMVIYESLPVAFMKSCC